MSPRIIIVHGIHTNDSEGWMDFLVERFRDGGWNAAKWTYGYAYAVLTRWQNPGRAKRLAALVQPGDVLLGHSNGGCLVWMAAELGAPIGGAILVNPALDSDKVMAKHVRWVNIYANRQDEAVKVATIFPAHPWGAQGRDGLTVDDSPRSKVIWTSSEHNDAPAVHGHSAVLEPGAIEPWSSRIVKDTNERQAEITLPGLKAA